MGSNLFIVGGFAELGQELGDRGIGISVVEGTGSDRAAQERFHHGRLEERHGCSLDEPARAQH